jgi:hypothetical protein
MSDVLKQVEEALVDLLPPFNQGYLSDAERQGFAALTAMRGLEWKQLSELGTINPGLVTVGRWLGDQWVTTELNCYADIIAGLGYTHYTCPILPTPPKREDSCKS